jgi:hypothetical protein
MTEVEPGSGLNVGASGSGNVDPSCTGNALREAVGMRIGISDIGVKD